MFRHVLIIADIEGCTGCWSYAGSRFLTREWAVACRALSLDVAAAVEGCLAGGAASVTIKDFHRTGYNVLPELLDPRARVVHGYVKGPVPGLGDPGPAEALMFVGLHAASGTDGFLAHTLTSRIARLEVNGRPITEAELFSASLAPYGLQPVLFSGCEAACEQAASALPGMITHPLDKTGGPDNIDAAAWREGLRASAAEALANDRTAPHEPRGPFRALVAMRDGEAPARKIQRRWGFQRQGAELLVEAGDIHDLYYQLIRLAYLTPLIEKATGPALRLYNLQGRLGLAWVRRRLDRL